ncbi:MAG: 4'-phosphopantetheinyl transferase superfamily protein, partial [Gaiellales bacterium]
AALESLRSRRILGQELPYPNGGFHTPLFRDYTESHRRHYASIAFRRADIPLWSATTCAPYPDGADEVRELAVRHLVEPVRFRELIDALYAEGVRLFVQVGAGNLVGFIEDTLSGRPHLTIASNTPRRSGMEQLRIAVAALFVEGADVDLASVGIAARAPTDLPLGVTLASLDLPSDRDTVASPDSRAVTGDPVLDAFEANVRELGSASERVRAAYTVGVGRRPPQRPAAMMASGDPRPPGSDGGLAARKEVLRISVDEFPELVDHSFYRQPDGWPHLVDSHPVVPMTMSIALMADAVRRLEPGREVVSFESVGARRWLVVEPPAEVVIRTSRRGDGAVEVTIEGHVDGLARTAREFPPAPEPDAAPLSGEREPPIEARDLYADRWLFHGPSYAGIGRLEALADDGIRARFVTLPAKGALLDAAGQLFGYWIKAMMPKDRLALPVGVRRIEFYRPDPAPGEELDCTVRVREVGDLLIEADIELTQAGRLYAALAGWVDRRFETDERIWGVMHFPEHNLLAEPRPGGYVVLDDSTYAMPAPDYLARRFLSEIERGELDGLPPRRRREWVRGRVAAKDAVRHLLREEQREPLYPIEVAVSADEDGRPQVAMESGEDIRVSIAHKGSVAVAIAALGRWPGIDLEPVEERDPAFVTRAFGPGELAHLPAPGSEWITRMWCAKEAAGKARRTGLAGAPRELPVTDV